MDNENQDSKKKKKVIKKLIRIALAGNPNVGKSVIFNQLTGMSQVIGNWPGKTVAKAEGTCTFQGYTFQIIDLPGIYSLSTYSLEEIVSREYIVDEKPDYIINVVDSNQLERNLFFTFQLQMLNRPIILALNQFDILQKRGYDIDEEKLGDLLGIETQKVVAVHNRGVHELLEKIILLEENKNKRLPKPIIFGKEIEENLDKFIRIIQKNNFFNKLGYPPKFMALKLLENDEQIIDLIKEKNLDKIDQIEKIIYQISEFRLNLEELHGHQISTIVNAELYSMAFEIYQQVEIRHKQTKVNKFRNFVDHITVHSIWGYFILALILLGSYFLVFLFGNEISSLMDALLTIWTPGAEKLFGGNETWLYKIIWDGFISGLFAGVGGVLPYVIPFYFVIEILQDIGYLPRAAYLMDRFMHKIGVHGKTIIPMLLGFGCSVPAVSACTIMETEQQRRRSILISTLIPCSAITTIIMGLIANFLGIGYAFLMYGIVLIVIIAVGKVLNINSDNKESELIIELHDFRKPNFKVIFKQAWHRSKEFVYMALPLIIILGILMQILMEFNLLNWINIVFQPLTVYVLGLPIGISIYLLYGFLRKELNLILLSLYISSLNMTLNEYMTPIQMIVFMIVTLFYLPCLATFITIRKEAGKKFAWKYLLFRIVIASILAALFRWLYEGINLIFPDSVMKFSGKFLITYLLFGMTIFTLVYIYKVHKKNHPFKRKHKRYNSEYHKKQHGLKREHHKMHQKSKIKEFYKLQTCKTCSHLGNCPLVTQGRSCSDIDIENPEFVYEKDDKK